MRTVGTIGAGRPVLAAHAVTRSTRYEPTPGAQQQATTEAAHRSPHWSEGDYPESPGRIVLGRNGSARLRISWDTDEDGREDVVVEGERISMATTKKWFWWRDR